MSIRQIQIALFLLEKWIYINAAQTKSVNPISAIGATPKINLSAQFALLDRLLIEKIIRIMMQIRPCTCKLGHALIN